MKFMAHLFQAVKRGEMAAIYWLLELLAGAAFLATEVLWYTD